jgi:chromosome segregation ATPase
MAQTLEDLDRRVTALELAQSARGENALARIEQKVDALHRVAAEMIAESEQRNRADMRAVEQRLSGRIYGLSERVDGLSVRVDGLSERVDGLSERVDGLSERVDGLSGRISATERRFIDILNERFDAIMVALDRPKT